MVYTIARAVALPATIPAPTPITSIVDNSAGSSSNYLFLSRWLLVLSVFNILFNYSKWGTMVPAVFITETLFSASYDTVLINVESLSNYLGRYSTCIGWSSSTKLRFVAIEYCRQYRKVAANIMNLLYCVSGIFYLYFANIKINIIYVYIRFLLFFE